MIRRVFVCLAAVVSVLHATAQQADREQLRMAQAYERSGDTRNAARLYQELYAGSPQTEAYFDGVVRTLQALDQVPSLYPIVVSHAQRTNVVSVYMLAGTLAAKLGKSDERDSHWKKVREISGNEESTLVALGRAQTQVFLFTEALQTYMDARAQNGSPTAYSDEVVTCLVATGKQDMAIQEILSDYEDELDLPLIVRKLSVVLANEGTAPLLEAHLVGLEQHPAILRLSLWFYRLTKSWDKALAIAIKLDNNSKQPGSEILAYADGARTDDQYDIAIEAYRKVMLRTKDQRLQTSAAYGAVRALEQKLRASSAMSVDDARSVVASYDDVIQRFGQHPLAADALYHSALILDDVLHDIDESQRRLLRLTSFWKGASVTPDAAMRLADIYLSQRLDSAAKTQLQLVRDLRSGVNEKADVAQLRLADLALWSGDIDVAATMYSDITSNPGSIAANDALDRMLLLQLREDDSAGVAVIIRAEELFARRSYKAAAAEIGSNESVLRDQDLKDRGSFLAAKACVAMNDTLKAEPFLLAILHRMPESIYGDQALWMLAQVSEYKNDPKAAMQYLESLLVYYPRSILAPDARERIRKLRGDA
ncbi:MAG: tetratricopeptide repeat protein [Ignavibacteria bacterium]|nr:tetratricopeptide repeat protein [Ignavibacteria bacterium]